MSRRLLALLPLAAGLLLTACATRHTEAPRLVAPDGRLQQTHYQGELKSEDGTLIRYTVFQPALAPGETAPLLLQTHPFGFWRMSGPRSPIGHILTSGDVVRQAWKDGYWVISFDQRGHGDSGDVMHIADPEKEGRDVSRLIDWAMQNLAITAVDGDPKIGMIGESYGAGIQLVASTLDPRIDALVPIGGWYDLERVLAPNDVPKSGWLTLLVLAGNTLADYDNRLNGAYWRARDGHIDQWVRDEFADHDVSWFCERGQAPHADALILQGFRDVLFPVNEGLDVRACLQQAGRDVRFIGIEDGHLLPLSQHTPGWMVGWNVEKTLDCDGRKQKTEDVIRDWFEAKLRGRSERLANVPDFCLTGDPQVDAAGAPPARQTFALARAHVGSGASGLVEWAARPLDHVKNWFVPADGNDWQQPRNGWLRPALIPLQRAETAQWVAGVPRAKLVIDRSDRDAPVLFLQVAAWRPGSGSYRILSQQVTPVRGTGTIETDLAAVRGKLEKGEVVGLLVRGYQSQYRFSGSGWGTDASIGGSVELPLAQATTDRDGKPAVASDARDGNPGTL
ncbi:MAG: alpha/beta hydrolase family protein [Pseudomonadota bacterium]